MKQSLQEHANNIEQIEKIIKLDEKWYAEIIHKRKQELEFYKMQYNNAESRGMKQFDRSKFLVK